VKAVHDKGGKIFAQLFHAGRACTQEQIGGEVPVSASAIPISESFGKSKNVREAT